MIPPSQHRRYPQNQQPRPQYPSQQQPQQSQYPPSQQQHPPRYQYPPQHYQQPFQYEQPRFHQYEQPQSQPQNQNWASTYQQRDLQQQQHHPYGRIDNNRFTGSFVPVVSTYTERPHLKRAKYDWSSLPPPAAAMIPTSHFIQRGTLQPVPSPLRGPLKRPFPASSNMPGKSALPFRQTEDDEDYDDEEVLRPVEVDNSNIRTVSIVVSNIVARFDTKCKLDLKRIVRKCHNVELQHSGSRIAMAVRNPKGTAVIYKSGRVVCNGTSTVDDAYKLARRVARCIQKSGVKIDRLKDYRIVNVFSSVTMPFKINMFKLYRAYKDKKLPESTSHISSFSYEPEIHTGVNIKLKDLGVVMKGFSSGHITVIGHSVNNIEKACAIIYPLFKLCNSTTKP